MSTDAQPSDQEQTTAKTPLNDAELAWLGRIVGGKQLYAEGTGLIARDANGDEFNIAEVIEELKEFDSNSDLDDEPAGFYAIELMEKRELLKSLGVPGIADVAQEDRQKREKKLEALDKVRNLIELQKEDIRSSTDYKVKVKRRAEVFGKEILYGSKTVSTKVNKGDWTGLNRNKYDSIPEHEFDEEHYEGRVIEGPSPEQQKALNFVMTQLKLLTSKLTAGGEVELSPQELMDEIWTPMVREGLVSANQCPVEFSRILELFKGANELYNERLKDKAREEEDRFEDVRDHLDDLEQVLGIGASVLDIALSAAGVSGDTQEMVQLIIKCTQGGISATSSLLEREKDFQSASSSIGDIIGDVIGEVTGNDSFGVIGKSAFLAVSNAALTAKKLAAREYDDAFELLSEAVASVFECIGEATGVEAIGDVSRDVKDAMNVAYAGGKVIYLLSQEPVDTGAVLKELQKVSKIAASNAASKALAQLHELKLEEQKVDLDKERKSGIITQDEYDEKIKEIEDEQSEESDTLDGIFDDLLEGAEGSQEDIEKSMEKLALAKGAKQAEQQMRTEREEYGKRLSVAFGGALGANEVDNMILEDLYSIDRLIAQIEQDRAIIQLFNTIFDAVGATIGLLIPQLGGPLKAKQFAMNLAMAIERSTELLTFTKLVSDARKATSPQAPALLAQVDELKRHLTNDSLEAAIALGQAVSLTVAAGADFSGPGSVASVVARGVNAGLGAFKKAKDLLKKKFEDRKVKKAWDTYRNALKNPRDRRLAMRSFRKNPTLAKYAVAYGAIGMDDPIARETLRQCGLNDMVLAQENTDAEKVVQFLEAKFNDDITVVGIVSRFAPTTGDPISVEDWSKNKAAAQHPDNPPDQIWNGAKTTAIDVAFVNVQQLEDEITKNDIQAAPIEEWAETLALWRKYVDSMDNFIEAVGKFKPMTLASDGNPSVPFVQFEEYLSELGNFVKKQRASALDKIAAQTVFQKTRYDDYQLTVVNSGKSIAAIKTAQDAIAHLASGPQLLEFCKTGEGKKLVGQLAGLATESPMLINYSDNVRHTVEFTLRKAERDIDSASSGGLEVELNDVIDGINQVTEKVKQMIAMYESAGIK